ncbi:ComF family protein [Haloglycomyces albus]|uniref:ComF family protein n=1 Tax=Haloglycomyces albus TaxID=526067 RepID=UPI00046D65E2|nr:phosphoribosyltransferase family protein [Haloglycomyces albus]
MVDPASRKVDGRSPRRRTVWNVATDLFFPAPCAGCRRVGDTDAGLCHDCAAELAAVIPHAVRRPCLPPIATAGPYQGVLVEALCEYKERSRRELALPLSRILMPVVTAVAGSLDQSESQVTVVPIPTTPRAYRRRGFDHVRHVARRLPAAVAPWLKARNRPDSVGLDDRSRLRAARRSLYLGSVPSTAPRGAVVLLDDVVTTGATMRVARELLEAAGIEVHGIVALAVAGR